MARALSRLFLIILLPLALSDDRVSYEVGGRATSPLFASNASTQTLDSAAFLAAVASDAEKPPEAIESSRRWHYETTGGRQIGVYDSLYDTSSILALEFYVSSNGWWRFVYPDSAREDASANDNVPWEASFDALVFARSRIGHATRQAVQSTARRTDVIFYPFDVTSKLVRRLDNTHVHAHARENDVAVGEEYSTVMYLKEGWRKNDYGDLLLFDEDMEIVAPVKPHRGRLVVWDSTVPYLSRPPSVNVRQGQRMLFVRWTRNVSLAVEWELRRRRLDNHRKTGYSEGLPFSDDESTSSVGEIDVAKYEINRYMTSTKKGIIVFDDLFSKDELDRLRSYIISHGKYFYDDSLEADSDNVHWISGYPVDDFVRTTYWLKIRQVARYVSGGHDGWFPYDVSCNLIRAADHTRIHLDCLQTDDQWTFLLYLSPNWTADDLGETAFYDREEEGAELVAQVRPAYGRAAIFHGTIPHSARPPSSRFLRGRYSFAVKVAHSTWQATVNEFKEKAQHKNNLDKLETIADVIKSGRFSEAVEKQLQREFQPQSESIQSKLERGIWVEEEEEDDGEEEEDEDEEITEEDQETLELLESDVDFNVELKRMTKRLDGDEKALKRQMDEFDRDFDEQAARLHKKLEEVL